MVVGLQCVSIRRVVGLIRVQGVDTGEAIVMAGAAWYYSHYDHDPVMPGLEAAARREGRVSGLIRARRRLGSGAGRGNETSSPPCGPARHSPSRAAQFGIADQVVVFGGLFGAAIRAT